MLCATLKILNGNEIEYCGSVEIKTINKFIKMFENISSIQKEFVKCQILENNRLFYHFKLASEVCEIFHLLDTLTIRFSVAQTM